MPGGRSEGASQVAGYGEGTHDQCHIITLCTEFFDFFAQEGGECRIVTGQFKVAIL